MPSLELLIPFALATLLFAVMPGPAILYTAAQTLARGRKGGYLAALGIHLGGMVHVLASAAGLSAALALIPEAYLALKIVGGLYLLWLAVGIIRGSLQSNALPKVSDHNPRKAFFESITVEVLNPKAALFYVSFLPQFVDPAAALPIWSQFLILGWVVNLAFSAMDIVTIHLTSAVLSGLRKSDMVEKVARRIGGGILFALGLHILASDR